MLSTGMLILDTSHFVSGSSVSIKMHIRKVVMMNTKFNKISPKIARNYTYWPEKYIPCVIILVMILLIWDLNST